LDQNISAPLLISEVTAAKVGIEVLNYYFIYVSMVITLEESHQER